jgi:hypothetical protein
MPDYPQMNPAMAAIAAMMPKSMGGQAAEPDLQFEQWARANYGLAWRERFNEDHLKQQFAQMQTQPQGNSMQNLLMQMSPYANPSP